MNDHWAVSFGQLTPKTWLRMIEKSKKTVRVGESYNYTPYKQKVQRRQKEEIVEYIKTRLQDGKKFTNSIIYRELIKLEYLSENQTYGHELSLSMSMIGRWIKEVRGELNMGHQTNSKKIIKCYNEMMSNGCKLRRTDLITEISKNIGCGRDWVLEIIKREEDWKRK